MAVYQAKQYLTRFHESLLEKRLNQLKESFFEDEQNQQNNNGNSAQVNEDEDEDMEPDLVPYSEYSGPASRGGNGLVLGGEGSEYLEVEGEFEILKGRNS